MKRRNDIPLGWACLVIGIVTMCFSLWLFPVYGLLYAMAFTISILAMKKEQVFAGVALLLVLLVVPTTIGGILAIYRGAVAVDKGIGFIQKHAHDLTMEAQQSRNARAAEADHAKWEAAHRVDPAFGEWTATLWDANDKPIEDGGGAGGFVRYDGQNFAFVTPLDDIPYQFRVFNIDGGGKRGEWRVEPSGGDTEGWFELDSRTDPKQADQINFHWNNNQSTEGPKRGSFRRNWLRSSTKESR